MQLVGVLALQNFRSAYYLIEAPSFRPHSDRPVRVQVSPPFAPLNHQWMHGFVTQPDVVDDVGNVHRVFHTEESITFQHGVLFFGDVVFFNASKRAFVSELDGVRAERRSLIPRLTCTDRNSCVGPIRTGGWLG